MRVTRRAEYALRALLDMAEHADEGPLRIEEIARRQHIPRNFLANLLVPLKRARLVQSKKGPEGGYFLSRPARRITVGEVLRLLDGPVVPINCVSRELGEKCELGGDCGYFPLWQRVRDAVAAVVDQTTVADVLEEHQRLAPTRRRGLIYHI